MQKIICYGDSNTFGAHGFNGGRYHKNERWTGILAESLACDVVNAGMNGREIPTDRWDLGEIHTILENESPFDLLAIMLGSNDLLMMFRSGMPKITARMENLLVDLLQHPTIDGCGQKILLIAPPPTQLSRYGADGAHFDQISLEFASAYKALADHMGVRYADAGSWQVDIGPDGVHFTAEGHKKFAEGLLQVLRQV